MKNNFDFEKAFEEIQEIEEKHRQWRTWTEDFEDEYTHEVVKVEHKEQISSTALTLEESDRVEKLLNSIIAHAKKLTDEQLEEMFDRYQKLAFLKEAMARNLDWAMNDDDNDINFVNYIITANAPKQVEAIEKLINTICQHVGLPENIPNDLPIEIPYSAVMKVLIGNDHFTGLIEHKERTDDALILKCSCTSRCVEALAEALRELFNVDVNIAFVKP